jgi:eukaryotic-like serine/threonine-protein kinase
MSPEAVNYDALLESLADGVAVDWAALDAAATTSDERRRYGNLRLVARVAELHRTLVLEDEDAAPPATPISRDPAAADPDRWGHLAIRARLASGSFGQIFRAHDPQLNREVALKLLRGDIAAFRPVERLLSEARTLARVRHPNVVSVYGADIRDGAAGLWMELVGGQTLEDSLRANGPLGAGEASAVGIDLCRALAAVHGAGLVHGDVKAQNVMRETGGRIVLMDFGAGRAQGADPTGVAGTPMYLAPEVLAGEPPTPQSDLYSLGVLLFHLLTAAYPYNADDLDGLRIAHADGARVWLRDLRPDLPDALVRSIERAIDEDPARRFATAGGMERALANVLQQRPAAPADNRDTFRGRTSASRVPFAIGAVAVLIAVVALIVWSSRARNVAVPSNIRSIAVLPMKDMSGPAGLPYLADGLHDQLIAILGQIQSLRVTTRSSVMQYKDSTKPAADIAKALGTDAVLETTVTSTDAGATGSAGRVRVNATLMMAGTGSPLWTRTFERPFGDLLALEGDIARAVAASAGATTTAEATPPAASAHQTTPAADAAYFQGRVQLLEGYGALSAQRALDAFERVLSLDSVHPDAHVGAAYAYVALAANGATTHQKARVLALEHVRQALAISDDVAEAHAAMGDLEFRYDWNIRAAEAEYRRALALNPSLANARSQYAELLAAAKRFDESLAQANLIDATEPGSAPALEGLLLYYKRDYPAAEQSIRQALSQRPNVAGLHILLGRIAEARGSIPEALDATRIALQLSANGGVPLRVQMVRLEALSGDDVQARKLLRDIQQEAANGSIALSARDLGYVWLAFGDRERALQSFARAFDETDPSLVWLGVDPRVDSLRRDARFASMLKRLGLP